MQIKSENKIWEEYLLRASTPVYKVK